MHLSLPCVELHYQGFPLMFVQDTIALAMPTMVAWMDKELRGFSSIHQVRPKAEQNKLKSILHRH